MSKKRIVDVFDKYINFSIFFRIGACSNSHMASCCRQRRRKTEPLPDSQEFKVLTPEHLAEVKELIKERSM